MKNLKRRVIMVLIILGTFIFIVYCLNERKIENKFIVTNHLQESSPELTFYLTQSTPSDSKIIKGEEFGHASSIDSGETEIIVSSTSITMDANIMFEYEDNNGIDRSGFVSGYISHESKKYETNLHLVEIDYEGVLTVE